MYTYIYICEYLYCCGAADCGAAIYIHPYSYISIYICVYLKAAKAAAVAAVAAAAVKLLVN